MSASPRRFILIASIILIAGSAGLWFAWKTFLKSVEKHNRTTASQPAKDKPRFVDYGRIDDFSFTNFDSREITRASLEGKIFLVDFIFTTCAGLCPVMSKAMQGVQERIGGELKLSPDDVRLLTVSTDPELDTLERLQVYANRYGADPARWHMVRGDFDAVQKFSEQALKLGLSRATPQAIAKGSEKVIHSNKFVLIDRRGHIRNIYSGTTPSDIERLMKDLPHLVKEDAGASK